MANPAHTRRKHFVNLWAEGLWGKLVAALWALYSLFAAIRGELPRQEDQEKYQVLRLMHNAQSISFSWWVAITLAILLAWVFEASFRRQRRSEEIIAQLQAKDEIPDLVVEVATLPEIWSTKIEDPPSKEGIYIFIWDIRFTNRSPMPLSAEVRLNIFLGDDVSSAPFLCPEQEDIPFQGMEQSRETIDASLGPHLRRIIAIPALQMKHGYLTYFIAKNLALFSIAPAAQSRDMRIIDFLNSRKKTLTVIEHISGQSRTVALDAAVQVSFRDNDIKSSRAAAFVTHPDKHGVAFAPCLGMK
ncbi:MAG: hypothetical protein WBF43_13550 [Methylocella sp.]